MSERAATTTVEPRQVKSQQRKSWEAQAGAWRKWGAVKEPALAPVTEALLDMAGVQAGQWVLDVACGVGHATLAAARRVGRDGRVVGVDLAPTMVALAEERARDEGVAHASFHELDAEALVGWPADSYNAAVCQFGLVYLPQLAHALRGVHHVLTPDGWFASAVWAPPDRVPFIALAKDTIHRVLGVPGPAPGQPHAFALAERGVLEQALSSAGFTAIRGERVTVVVELPSAAEYAQMMRETTGLGALVAEHAPDKVDEVWDALAAAAAPYAGADGKVAFTCDASCVAGRRA
jgi:ubiquinone/menaquinone biosynthesis C-methylase UbiE